MEYINVIFGRSSHPISIGIRLFTWSRWSHVGALTGNGREVIESVGDMGVTITPLPEFKRRYKEWRICRIPVKDRDRAFHLLRSEVGKPYDMTAIYGLAFRRDWEESDSWFCSELIAHATGMFRKDYIKRITPEDLWRISED